jgi:parallel beta-helix repeat protein
VAITEDDVRLMAQGPVVLRAGQDQEEGIAVGRTTDPACLSDASLRVRGSLISGFTVEGFEDDGVFLYCVEHWRITDTTARDNLEYGLFPSHVVDGRLDHSFASGANDTGIYLGQSRDARMDHNVARDNVSGFEIENSTGVRLDHNLATGNTGGILSFALPFLDVSVNADNVIEHNEVRENNRPNTCLEPGDVVCQVYSGSGILVVAADRNVIRHNDITGNHSLGIGVANFCVSVGIPPEDCAALDIEPNSDDNRVIANDLSANGTDPDPTLPPVFAVDLAWDGTGTDNCWSGNVAGTMFPPQLPACP